MKVLVLGGGISGLSVAWNLSERDIECDVIESKKDAGGLASTINRGQYHLDYGPHFFLSEREAILKKILGLYKRRYKKNMPTLKRDAKLFFHGRFLDYPLTMKNVLFQIPIYDSFMIASSYFLTHLREKFRVKKDSHENFETWARRNFGNYLFKYFFKPYTEQFWGIPTNKLSPHCLPTNTKLSFFKTLKLMFQRKIANKNLSLVERETTLKLHYPPKGIGMVSNAIAEQIHKAGNNVYLGYTVEGIAKKNKKFFVTASVDGKKKSFTGDMVISTIPLTEMTRMLQPSPPKEVIESSNKLDFLSIIIIYIVTEKRNILSSSYLYFLGRPYNRISETNKFSPELCPPSENMLAIEISCRHEEPIWTFSDDKIYDLCIRHLERDRLLSKKDVKKYFVIRARHAYPIYFHDYEANLKRLLNHVESVEGLHVVGRAGKYMYMDIDQSMVRSFELVHKLNLRK